MTDSHVLVQASRPFQTPSIPPVMNLKDVNGVVITLDCEVILERNRHILRNTEPTYRARVVAIGDPGLPGREVLKVRPHGSNYIETVGPADCEVHIFDDYLWTRAEEASAKEQDRLGRDLTTCLFGGFYFEPFQRFAIKSYVEIRAAWRGYV